ncbi:DEAD/DEAH box helicase [Desulfopila aestuarii]|uniref:DEAD/DEAH box helicase domain-containing protein n=1 Tax=Desulfopila aestuarii DSM 18488 TaxID=1121416 RepID=A0A1M7Y1D8_9BACT|nr:DEAD/DEAH box helicase [Desulfopila aestuarii]SHO45329.1 DEAD/DEAH box helicase domain-containing protein [Desulfopila aestuarii DSM 18488]
MSESKGVHEYLLALIQSRKFGPQVIARKVLPAKESMKADVTPSLTVQLRDHLKKQGIDKLYSHQQHALELIKAGHDIVAATPTASGKSMIYNLPVMDMLLSANPGNSLYIFPLKALAQDQLRVFNSFTYLLPQSRKVYGAIFDGDTSPYTRRRIREESVPVLMTNPEMLHLSLLPYHGNWVHFFKDLRFVVIDEVHTYRGVLGGHMAWILRRLQRICSYYGSNPQFILLSATIGNPGELAEKLTGRKVTVISENGAPSAEKHVVLLNPWDSAAYTASQLLEASIKRGLRTIVYTQSRKMTELINLWTRPKLGDKENMLSSYRAGFLPEERREIEARLTSGELLGVISTSALELGIDIGDLDVCILVGYPGSIMATWQRGGRVGRNMRESAIILIGQEDALDQYFMRQPEDFFARKVESAPLNPFNTAIMEQHLHCGCAELVLRKGEPLLESDEIATALKSLTDKAVLLQSADGATWFSSRKYPQRHVSLRGGGTQLSIINSESGEIIGEVDSSRAMKECHPGALYLHRARTWVVASLDFEAREVVVSEQSPSWFTRPMSNKNTTILGCEKQTMSFRGRVSFGPLRVTEHVTGYQKRNNSSQKLIATYPLDLPEQTIETVGLWLDIPAVIKETMEEEKYHFMGAIHAVEHAMIALFPLLILCDRNDIGGISCPLHDETEEATIFVYDGHAGGIGLCEEAFGRIDELLTETSRLVSSCSCENGCPSCVHSPKCGSGNRPIDKIACLRLLELLLETPSGEVAEFTHTEPVTLDKNLAIDVVSTQDTSTKVQPDGLSVLPERYGVFDLETIRSADEVGGWNRAEKMGISVAVVYDSALDGCVTYLEHEISGLIQHLQKLELIIGFNNKRFDNQVLSGYTNINLNKLPTLDLLEQVSDHLGYRLSLDRLAEHTLGEKKTADGLQALAWYKEGRIDLIQKYCRKDVEITRDILHFALENGYLLFQNKAGKVVRLPLNLEKPIRRILKK